MSSNAVADGDTAAGYPAAQQVRDVGFASISTTPRHAGEASERAESRSSDGKRSSTRSWRKEEQERDDNEKGEEFVTPSKDDGGRKRGREEEVGTATGMGSLGHRARKSGGFLLESVFANGAPKGPGGPGGGQGARSGKEKVRDGQHQQQQLRVDKRRGQAGSSRLSAESSSQRSSPLAREVSWVDGETGGEEEARRSSRQQNMDAAQLVQMALNLSESRKRNVSNTLQVPLPSPASRRVSSGPVAGYGTPRTSSAARRRSGQLSDDGSRDSPKSKVSDDIPLVSRPEDDNVLYTFSPATLSRAEKARKYFELASEHRRLLHHLPPLKPDASAPGNYTFESTSTPGSAFPEIRRVMSSNDDKHALGRQYNPIQALRNRRVRIREKRPFPAPPDSWADPENVKKWIDDVETATRDPYYRAIADEVQIPHYGGDEGMDKARMQQSASGHRRTDTVGSVITRPENSWTIEPTELLADAYWTEQGDNKAHIENRHGNPIFPQAARRSVDAPRISVELHRGKDEQNTAMGIDSEDFEDNARPSRRRKLMMPLTTKVDEHRKKHRRLISRSPSSSSSSSVEGARRNGVVDENIGPLERHMQELIAKDERGELSSPEVASPEDHWDSKPVPFPRFNVDQPQHESVSREGRSSLEVPRDLHRRTRSADGRYNSIDPDVKLNEHRGSEPTSPKIQISDTAGSLDMSAVAEGRHSLDAERTQTASKLLRFRAGSKDRNNIDQLDFAAATASNLSPILSGDPWRPRTSQDTERPSDPKRHRTNESLSSSLNRIETSSTTGTFSSIREPGSTVGRLFKGGRDRIGTLVRGERFRKGDRLEAGAAADGSRAASSDVSDMEDGDGPNGHLKRRITDSAGDESDVSPRASLDRTRSRQKYQLPSFTSSARDRRLRPGAPISPETNPFERDRGTQADGSKISRLVPPRLNIPEEDDTDHQHIRFNMIRKSYGDLGLDAPLPSAASTAISRSPGQRHWSIYDQAQPIQQASKITARDIARVRALLLCSGIKAREIQRIGNSPRGTTNIAPELTKAAGTANTPVTAIATVPLKDEQLTAARLLSDHLTSSFTLTENAIAHFQTTTVRALAAQLDELRHKAADQLTTHVHEASDEADAFVVELTTKQPQQTKRVDEAVDTMVRRRRRQFRLLRQLGFKLLEWLVLGIMWWIWFLVVVFNTGRKAVVLVVRFVRWLVVF